MSNGGSRKVLLGLGIAALLSLAPVVAAEHPDSAVNHVSGAIEVVDAAWSGSNFDIRFTVNAGGGQSAVVTTLTSDPLDDLDPRLAISAGGDVWVAWWRAGSVGEVLVRKRAFSSGQWSVEQPISAAGEDSRNPRIVHDGTRAWIAYEFTSGGHVAIGVTGDNDPQPWPWRTVIGETTYEGDRDLRMSFESGRLWVTWVDSNAQVAWSAYSYATGTWSAPGHESYASDSVDAARGRIRTTVLND